MRTIKYIMLSTILLFAVAKVQAVAPTWSVNPASFQYSMSVNAVVNINCLELTNPSVRVGAFVGNELRGTALTSNVTNGRFVAGMIVYSNLVSGEQITFKMYNPVNDSIYDARVSVQFQDNANYGTSVAPYEVKSNNAPTAIQLSNNSVSEGQAVNSVIGALTASDIDASETFSYTLVSGAGSTDNANFNISGSSLRTNTVLSYLTKSTHSIRVRATDANGCFVEQNFTITVVDVNTPPTALFITDSTVNENQNALAVIGVLSALDGDPGDVMSYTLVSGIGSTDNASFNIVGATLRTSAVFNYENKSSYSIRVRVTDAASNTFERVFTILINDINDAPTNIAINGSSTGTTFAENKALGSVIGVFSTTDEDALNTFSYSFVNTPGNNNSDFAIIGNQLRTNTLFDYETRQNYVIFIQTNDGNGGLFTKQLLLTVTDSNDAPTAINLTNNTVYENNAAGTFVGKLSTTDPDGAGTFTYNLVSGAGSSGNANFTISNDSIFTSAVFDFESVSSYSIRVQTTDAGLATLSQNFTINVLNANDVPTDINLTANLVQENSAANTTIGNLSTVDQDAGNTFVYTLVNGVGASDNNNFNISGNILRTSASFDYETKSTYSVRLRATDNGGLFTEKVFTITVTDVVDAPTNIVISNDSINENLPINSLVGNLSGVTQDAGSSFTFSFDNAITTNDNASFIISGNQLRTNASFDYEAKNIYSVYINASVGTSSYTKLIQVFVKNQNDAPTDIALSYNTIKENRPSGSFIGTFTSTDADAGNTFSYDLVSGSGSTDNALFRVSNDSLYTLAVLNFEQQNSFAVRVRTTDNNLGQFSKSFTIMVSDSNDAPTGLSLSANAVQENLPIGSAIATLSTVDADAGQNFTYSLVSGLGSTHNSLFYIQAGQLKTNAVFNFEQQSSYQIRVQTNDGNGGVFADTFSIYVLNVNDAPTLISLSNNQIKENKPVNSVLGVLSTTDQDANDVFLYSFANVVGNDNEAFFINGNEIRTNAVFNFETKQVYNIYIQSTDGLASITKQFVINVLDSNDAPTNFTLSNNTVSENQPIRTFIATLTTDDIDVNQTFTYSLVTGMGSTNNAAFVVSNDTLYSNSTFNFESKSSYSIRLRATDNGGLSFEKQVEILINNINDEPTDITLSSNEITENRLSRTPVGTFSTSDQDVANTFSYALVSGTGSTDNAAFVIVGNELRSNRMFNFEQQNTFSIRVQSNDGQGGTTEKAFVVSVIDSNDAPTNIVLSTNSVAENMMIGTKVCDLSTIDQDVNDDFLYSFANVTGNNNANFLIIGNELRTNTIFDFETKNFYIIVLAATDAAGATYTKQFVINIRDSVDAPTALDLSNNSVAENEAQDAYVGTLGATDADQFSGFTYTLVPGLGANDNASFRISNDSLLTAATFNYEGKKVYAVRIRVTDATGAHFERAFVINITDANDAPTALTLSANTLLENKSILTEIGHFTTADVDASDAHMYALISGTGSTDNAMFVIEGNTLRSNVTANFEVKNTYSIRVSSQDNGGSTIESVFVINVVDVSEKPTINPQTFSANENAAVGTSIGNVVSSSPDAGANLVYSILGGSNLFDINPTTGELTNTQLLDYEKGRSYTISVVVKDDQTMPLFDTALMTIVINDEIETKQALPANNYMSPNNDGINDFFTVENVAMYADYSLTIYSEAGMQVYFVANNYQNNWDGTYKGKELPSGVYFFVFANSKTGEEFKGSINMVK